MEYLAEGGPGAVIDDARAEALVARLLARLEETRGPLRRVLILPPDVTRLHSGAGPLTVALYNQLKDRAEVALLPAIGTHFPMTDAEIAWMYPGIPANLFHPHDWRDGVVTLGEVPASFVREVSEGKLDEAIPVQVDRLLVEQAWDAIISVGQLVPHEVIGIANHAKNVLVGVGGSALIHRTHYIGAVYGMERIMGRADTPVRRVLDYAMEHLAKDLPVVYLLTVRARTADGHVETRGLFAGDDNACFRRGAELCRAVNLDRLDRAPSKVVVYLDPLEFKSTWLGNKAVYRTRMAIADGGELIVLAPGVREFGEDPTIDRLIRRHGYRGTPATLDAVRADPELAANLSAAAHLIHGSSEGRFRITYAPGGLTREEVEGAGFAFGDLGELMRRYPPETIRDGWNLGADGEEFYYISNPGLGLWGTGDRFGDS